MTCRELAEFIMAYLDGELSAPQRAEFEQHMSVCPPCVRYLDSYRKTVAASRSLANVNPPEPVDIPDDLVKAILAAREKR
jgi:anti-sigma factor RsiW